MVSGTDPPSDTREHIMSETETRATATHTDADSAIETDLLVEDVSIDGMCGVY
jgi:mycofactocin precursor